MSPRCTRYWPDVTGWRCDAALLRSTTCTPPDGELAQPASNAPTAANTSRLRSMPEERCPCLAVELTPISLADGPERPVTNAETSHLFNLAAARQPFNAQYQCNGAQAQYDSQQQLRIITADIGKLPRQ